MLLPGPEAQQLAIYAGWLLHKTWGGIVAGAANAGIASAVSAFADCAFRPGMAEFCR
jgi:chromate transport protein ChrA